MKMTLEEYRKLDATGMLWEFYPEGVQIIPEKQKRSVRDTTRNMEKPHIEPAKAMNMEEIGEKMQAQLKRQLNIVNEACNSPMNIFEAGVMTGKIDTLVAQQKESALDTQVQGGVGDVNSKEKGSGARYNEGKPDFSLIPLCTLADEARVWAYGKKKYAAWNWAKGMEWSIPYSCAMRHLSAWQRGEENDQESGLPHLAHAISNLRMLTLYKDVFPAGDDRPTRELEDAK